MSVPDEVLREVEDRLGVEITGPMAYEGREGCDSLRCRRMSLGGEQSRCIGWHCAACGEPSSQYGHKECRDG